MSQPRAAGGQGHEPERGQGRGHERGHERKRAVRAAVRRRLAFLTAAEATAAGEAIAARFDACGALGDAGQRGTALCFASLPDEPPTGPLVARLQSLGMAVAFPAMMDRAGTPGLRLASGIGLELAPASAASSAPGTEASWSRDAMGVLCPAGPAVDPGSISLAFVPGRAFDCMGVRLGRGGGHFDRLLAGLPAACWRIGVCFDAQVEGELPREPHDIPVHALLTPTRFVLVKSP